MVAPPSTAAFFISRKKIFMSEPLTHHQSRFFLSYSPEIGYFYADKSPERKIIGIRTDYRRAGEREGVAVNATIECSCDWIVRTRKELRELISVVFLSFAASPALCGESVPALQRRNK
jgi:hypothetical protein